MPYERGASPISASTEPSTEIEGRSEYSLPRTTSSIVTRTMSPGSHPASSILIDRRGCGGSESGAEGIRTPGLDAASVALSQLSYGPVLAKSSRELEVASPVDALALVVPGRSEPELNRAAVREALEGEVVAAISVNRVSRESVDLVCRIRAMEQPVAGAPAGAAANDDHVAVSRSPLALNAHEPSIEVEDEVEPPPSMTGR